MGQSACGYPAKMRLIGILKGGAEDESSRFLGVGADQYFGTGLCANRLTYLIESRSILSSSKPRHWIKELTMEWIVRLVNDETRFTRFVKRLAYSTGAFGVVVLLLLVNESIKRIY